MDRKEQRENTVVWTIGITYNIDKTYLKVNYWDKKVGPYPH